jgi:hypothetical protein
MNAAHTAAVERALFNRAFEARLKDRSEADARGCARTARLPWPPLSAMPKPGSKNPA